MKNVPLPLENVNPPSAYSFQAALKSLLNKDFVTQEANIFQVYGKFFAECLIRKF